MINSTSSNARRSNIPSLPRVANNGTDATTAASTGTLNRPPSAGDALRRLTFTRKLNRSNSEKINTPGTSSSNSPVNNLVNEINSLRFTIVFLFQHQSGNNSMNQSTNSLEEMSLSFMKVSAVKTAASSNDQQAQTQQQNTNKKKVNTYTFTEHDIFYFLIIILSKRMSLRMMLNVLMSISGRGSRTKQNKHLMLVKLQCYNYLLNNNIRKIVQDSK